MANPSSDFDPSRYWETRLRSFDLSAVGYQALGLPYNRWLYRQQRSVFRRAVRGLEDGWNGKDVLDVGSGTGFYVAEWLKLHASVSGSDLTRISVERLSARFPRSRFVQWDVAEPPPFAPSSFDAISAVDVLYHIVDDERYRAAFENISALLRDGGYFVFSENLLHGETIRVAHQASRALRDVEALLVESGLEVVLRRPMFVLMNSPIDSANPVLRGYWSVLSAALSRYPVLGGVAGAVLFPLDFLLVSFFKEGPSTELVVCRKSTGR
jgi:SAM-dependent methyltransferase